MNTARRAAAAAVISLAAVAASVSMASAQIAPTDPNEPTLEQRLVFGFKCNGGQVIIICPGGQSLPVPTNTTISAGKADVVCTGDQGQTPQLRFGSETGGGTQVSSVCPTKP